MLRDGELELGGEWSGPGRHYGRTTASRKPMWSDLLSGSNGGRQADRQGQPSSHQAPPRRTREQPRFAPSATAPLVFLALVTFFLVTGPIIRHSIWFERGTAVTDLALSTSPWRAVTASSGHR